MSDTILDQAIEDKVLEVANKLKDYKAALLELKCLQSIKESVIDEKANIFDHSRTEKS